MSNDIQKRSAEHLINLRAVYQKNPELIDEFVKALRFECNQSNEDCEGCAFVYSAETVPDYYLCRIFYDKDLQKLDGLMDLIKKDLPPTQEQILGVCITVSIGKDAGADGLPFVDDWVIMARTPEELVKNALDAVAGDMIENESGLFEDYAQSLAGSKVALMKAGDA